MRIAIVKNDHLSKARYLQTCDVPLFCMEDYSLLGFVVENFEAAMDVVINEGYRVENKGGGADIIIDKAIQLQNISDDFNRHGIEANFSDVADTLYQA